MSSKSNARNSNIELLRIIAILGVIILHYNNVNIGGGFKYVEPGSTNYWILLSLQSLNICAVNLFILISGYYLCVSDTRKSSKVLELSIQVIIFKAFMYIISVTLNSESFSIKQMVTSAVFDNYFIILYLVLYLISPYFNIIIKNINEKEYKRLIVLIVLLFSIWPICTDILMNIRGGAINGISTISNNGNGYGYTIVQFSLMYFIGGYIRKSWDNLKDIPKSVLLVILTLDTALMTAWGHFAEPTAYEYCNPFIIIQAVVIFLIFNGVVIKQSNIINVLASEAFSVFLLHDILIRHVAIEEFVKSSPLVMCGHIAISVCLIYVVCFICGRGYHIIVHFIFCKQ